MIDATAAALDVEIDAALQRAAKSRDELRRRAAAASERIRQRQTLARAEALAPHFRAEILRRARELQRARVRMLGTLRGLSTAVPTGTGTGAVLSALDAFVRAEESAAWWPLALPAASRWRAVRRAARDGDEADTDAAVASALAPVENEENEEEEEEAKEKEKDAPRLRVACVCSMAQFGRGAEVSRGNGSPNDSGGGAWGRREEAEKKERERRDPRVDEETDSEAADEPTGTDGELIRAVLQAAAAHMDALDAAAEKAEAAAEEAEDDAFDSAMEEARLRLSLELAARAVACRHAVESLAAGEDRNLFDGIAMVGAAPALALPAMEQFFYCAAYTVGAAIARDEANERQNRVDVDDEGNARSKEVANNTRENQGEHCETVGGWRGVMGRWVSAGLPMGPRLLRYLLEFVIRPYDGERDSEVRVAPVVVRAWLATVMQEEKDVGSAVDAVMQVFMREGSYEQGSR